MIDTLHIHTTAILAKTKKRANLIWCRTRHTYLHHLHKLDHYTHWAHAGYFGLVGFGGGYKYIALALCIATVVQIVFADGGE